MTLKSLTILMTALGLFAGCSPKEKKPVSYCEKPCLTDSIKFTSTDPGKSYVFITAHACSPDTLIWSNRYLENNRKMELSYLLGHPVTISPQYTECKIYDTSYAWLQFNDCSTFRGYLLKLPFNKREDISKFSSALTHFDPRFRIEKGLICYADYAFVYVEDMATGKKEQLKLADKELDIDFNNLHATFDSVNVTRSRIFVNLVQGGKKTPLEKAIHL
ncbi:MAG TPA: hypothetical protein VG870_02655 [Chitinophagaceae bacterium]|nr:hypothetical protein [Chitinophagaceae bacterium]